LKIGLALAGALFSCSLLPAQQSPGYTGLGQPPGAAVIGQQAIAQQTDEARGQGGSQPSTRSVLDYLNFFGMLNGIYDSSIPYQTTSRTGGVITDYGGAGAQVGGGVDFVHRIRGGAVSAFYNGSYTRYSRSQYTNATQQLLGLSLASQLSRHVSFTATESLNYSDNMGQNYSFSSGALFPSLQPYSSSTLANVTSLTLNWHALRRVTYFVGGDFYTSRYRPGQFTSYLGGDATAGATYQATQRDSLTGSITYTRFSYSNGAGNSDIGSISGSYSHMFNPYWSAGASVGVSRVVASGIASLAFGGVPNSEFQQGRFSQKTTTPTFGANLNRNFKHSTLSLTAGQSIIGGNGIYLTSKNVYGTANLSIQLSPRLRLGAVGGVNRLSSVANTASGYTSVMFGANAAYQLTERCFLNFAYQGWQYPKFGDLQRTYANRVSAGVTFTSKPYPISGF
jgi:hypothetical protein